MKHLLHSITAPVVCARCEAEFLAGGTDSRSLQDHVRVDVGFTDRGIQVWCRRHDLNVVHVDFDGAMPEADFRCLEKREGG